MDLSAVDQAFWFSGVALETILAGVLLFSRRYALFPIFLVFIVFTVLSDIPLFWVSQHGSPAAYERVYIITAITDYMLQFGVLVEIAYRVLRPGRRAMSHSLRNAMIAILLIGFAATVSWTLSQSGHSDKLTLTSSKLIEVNFAFSFLRLVVFALIAAFSQMLGVTWRSHVIRLAGGLAFYSAVSVVIQLTISHLSTLDRASYIEDYTLLSHTQTVGYLLALVFWVWSFVQKDAPRREFTPQMERFLVTISETAKRSRVGFARNMGNK